MDKNIWYITFLFKIAFQKKIFKKQPFLAKHPRETENKKTSLLGTLQTLGDVSRQSDCI